MLVNHPLDEGLYILLHVLKFLGYIAAILLDCLIVHILDVLIYDEELVKLALKPLTQNVVVYF